MTHPRSLAAAQTIPRRGDVDANLEQHVRLARCAVVEGAEVLVFPELSLTSYEIDLAGELAFSRGDPRLAPLVDWASEGGMTLIVGAPVRIDARLHIGAFIISPRGAIDLYTKQRLGAFAPGASPDGVVPPAERTVFHPGDLDPLVLCGGNTAAVAVCADTGRPSHAARAAERGARTYLASMFVIPSDLETEAARLSSYAARHSMAVVFANYGGPTGGLSSAGASAIWSDGGELLVRLDGIGAGIAFARESGAGWRGKAVTIGGVA